MKIVCVGDCGVDHYLPSGKEFPGGITSNFARQARRAFPSCDEIHVVSATGNDGAPAELTRSIFDGIHGIHCDFTVLEGATPVQYIRIEDDGEKNFVRYDEGVIRDFRIGPRQAADFADAELLVTPVFQQSHEMFESVLTLPFGGTVAVDFADFATCPDFPHLERNIDRVDIAFFGLHTAQRDIIARIAELAQSRQKLMIVTLGAAGSLAFSASDRHDCPAAPVDKVLDTTGAGDAFAAGFLSRFMHGASITESLDAGAALAAETIQCVGAVPA